MKNYEAYADEEGIRLNPNKVIVEAVIRRLVHNENIYGCAYCPCRKVTGKKAEDKKIICPCIFHRDEIREKGHCHCMLFVR
ncbi:MAG: ferredoxin:thioredoxin reductase [Candidatus Aenigmarchaeota archaeon]|nr:ferredoxin:thioredoxin reductase [Candidatus Aenigmarchaeota archaeon]